MGTRGKCCSSCYPSQCKRAQINLCPFSSFCNSLALCNRLHKLLQFATHSSITTVQGVLCPLDAKPASSSHSSATCLIQYVYKLFCITKNRIFFHISTSISCKQTLLQNLSTPRVQRSSQLTSPDITVSHTVTKWTSHE